MDRRQYLGAAAAGVAVGVVGVGGYTVLNEGSGPPAANTEFPPYPDAETVELSGDGPGTSDSFELQQNGPTILSFAHSDEADAENTFSAALQSTETQDGTPIPISTALKGVGGPYEGILCLGSVDPGEYELTVNGVQGGEPLGWDATVHDVPEYDDRGLSLPVKRADGLDAVIGPINFGERTPVEISLTIDTDTLSTITLFNRKGESVGTLLKERIADTYREGFSAEGIGYIQIDSNTQWTFTVEEFDEELPEGNESANESTSSSNTTQTNQTNSTTQSQSSTNTTDSTQNSSTNQSSTTNSTQTNSTN